VVVFFCANDIFATRQPVLRRQEDPKADRVNDVLSAVASSVGTCGGQGVDSQACSQIRMAASL